MNMRAIYTWLQQEPTNDNHVLAIGWIAALAIVAIDFFWGLPT